MFRKNIFLGCCELLEITATTKEQAGPRPPWTGLYPLMPGGAREEEQETRTETLPKHVLDIAKTNAPRFPQKAALETTEQLLKQPSKSQSLPNYLWQAAFLHLILE